MQLRILALNNTRFHDRHGMNLILAFMDILLYFSQYCRCVSKVPTWILQVLTVPKHRC